MVLIDPGRGAEGRAAVTELLHTLWDAGLNVGHSVRTVDEALAMHGATLDAWTAMLESRFLAGRKPLAEALFEGQRTLVSRGIDRWFAEGVFADIRSRQARFGNSVKLLEPNIKKSAGGLRDLHALFWLHRGSDARYFAPLDGSVPALQLFLGHVLEYGLLDQEQCASALQAIRFLFRVRHEMHIRRESQHDTLEYALQVAVAEGLGYGREAELRSVEVFMHDYYRHARTVRRLSAQLAESFKEIVEPSHHSPSAAVRAQDMFLRGPDSLGIERGIRRLGTATEVFEAFSLAAEYDLGFDWRLRGVIERSADLVKPEGAEASALAARFRRILNSNRVADTLRDMSELGVLERYIPEWGEIVAFFQHNVYHYYSADEHTLIALSKAESLRDERGMLREVSQKLRRRDILFLAVLLHDIAKPRGVSDHEVTGVGISGVILERIGLGEIAPDVGFLIRHHLAMEQIAFRRNIHDPATIKDFAGRFERPEWLDYLYVLTYADLAAVNPTVWTEWKAAMLQELYQRASEVLRRRLSGDEIDQFERARRAETEEHLVRSLDGDLPREEILRHFQGIQSDAYVATFSDREISRHIRAALQHQPVEVFFGDAAGYTEVTIIARDAPYALSKFCAVLAANDATIFDANIFTRDDGIIIDRFRVADASSRSGLAAKTRAKLEEDLRQVVSGQIDIGHLFREHRRKWKRRASRPVNPTVRIDVEFEETPRHTIIDVYAPDTVGFLFRVTETMSRLGLDICFAKIATRVDGIVDAFYVLDRDGHPVTDEQRRAGIREEILRTIRTLQELELT
jgi:[protein-PII] uridylyltransferase